MGLKKTSLKPGVKTSVHLFAAPFLWTTIGCMLMVRGFGWLPDGNYGMFLLLAFAMGTAKSLLMLDKTALKSIQRIVAFEDGTCLGAVYSWKTWLLVALMMASGITIRKVMTPGAIIGTVYLAIGWALFFSSRHGWRQWFRVVLSGLRN